MANSGNRASAANNAPIDVQTTEQKMRRALGLTGGGGAPQQQRPDQARHRHRFVQDGGVPVVVMNPKHDGEAQALKEKLASVEARLEAERMQNDVLRRAADEARSELKALQTRMAHAALAHREELAHEQRLRQQAQDALAAVQVRKRPARVQPAEDAAEQDEGAAEAVAAPEVAEPVVKRKRGRPRTSPPKEPKPLRWWTPSFKAKMKAKD